MLLEVFFYLYMGKIQNNHQIQILRPVPDVNADPLRPQVQHVFALGDVRAPDIEPDAGEHLRQRRHGHAADADQPAGLSRLHIFPEPIHIRQTSFSV